MYEGKIPFDQHGNPVPFPGHRASLVWEDNAPFHATLVFQRFTRGRSAAHAIFAKDDDPSWEVTMFLTDLTDVLRAGFAPLKLSGTFEHVKRGQNYGVKMNLIGS